MIVTTKPCGFARHDTSENRPFGKRNAPRALIMPIQIPFVMLRFILRKGAWLTLHHVAQLGIEVTPMNVFLNPSVQICRRL